jgi:hypothetical protein
MTSFFKVLANLPFFKLPILLSSLLQLKRALTRSFLYAVAARSWVIRTRAHVALFLLHFLANLTALFQLQGLYNADILSHCTHTFLSGAKENNETLKQDNLYPEQALNLRLHEYKI